MTGHDIGVPAPATVADHLAIQDVLYAYADGIDGRDWSLVSTVFTDDAHLDYRGSGGPAGTRPEVVDWIRTSLSPMGASQHVITNVRIRVDGDEAHAVSQLTNPLLLSDDAADVPALLLGGRYVDRLRRTEQGWRIAHRVQAIDWQTTITAAPGAAGRQPRPAPGSTGT